MPVRIAVVPIESVDQSDVAEIPMIAQVTGSREAFGDFTRSIRTVDDHPGMYQRLPTSSAGLKEWAEGEC